MTGEGLVGNFSCGSKKFHCGFCRSVTKRPNDIDVRGSGILDMNNAFFAIEATGFKVRFSKRLNSVYRTKCCSPQIAQPDQPVCAGLQDRRVTYLGF